MLWKSVDNINKMHLQIILKNIGTEIKQSIYNRTFFYLKGFSYRYKLGNCNLYLASRGFSIHRTLLGHYFFHICKAQYYTDRLLLSSISLRSVILVLGYDSWLPRFGRYWFSELICKFFWISCVVLPTNKFWKQNKFRTSPREVSQK